MVTAVLFGIWGGKIWLAGLERTASFSSPFLPHLRFMDSWGPQGCGDMSREGGERGSGCTVDPLGSD